MDWKEALEELHKKYMQNTDAKGLGTFKGFKQALQTPPPTPPQPHMADGGEVKETQESPIIVALRNYVMGHGGLGATDQKTADTASKVDSSSEPAKGYAQGGDVMPINNMMQSIQSTPPTDYSFYKNLTAEDRAALAQKLMDQQHSGGNLIASALAGIGDAVSNSYGGKNTTFQKDVEANAQKAADQQLAQFDTQRANKLQDFQANTQMAEQDPASSLSKQGRDFFVANGVQVPSGMNFAQLKTLAPSMADLVKGKWEQAFRESQLQATNTQNQASNALRADEIKRQVASDEASSRDREDNIKRQNLEGLSKMNFVNRFLHPQEAQAYRQGAGLDPASNGLSFDDKEKEARYQAWKAKQGR